MKLTLAASVLLTGLASAEVKRVIDSDFADPGVIGTTQGIYAFATQNGKARVPVAHSDNFYDWELLDGTDALPDPLPDWVNQTDPAAWAPDVVRRDDGVFVMYLSLNHVESGKHCIGVGSAESVTGPYKILDEPLACPTDQGGAIDPTGFWDSDGTRYVLYKVDGNSIGSSSTPIMIQKLASDAMIPVGDPVKLLDRNDVDGPLIEAPSMIKDGSGTYYLTFSSNWYNTLAYDVSYATGIDLSKEFTKAQAPNAPLLVSGDPSNVGPLGGPGGADFLTTDWMVFHAFLNGKDLTDGRGMWIANIAVGGGTIEIIQ